MHFLSAALFASGAIAAAVDRSGQNWDCILANPTEMAADAACGDASSLSTCLAELKSSEETDALAECYAKAGCSSVEAKDKADGAERRCFEMFGRAELRRRSRGELDARGPQPTKAPEFAGMNMFWDGHIFPRTAASGDDCLTFKEKETKVCDIETNDGKVSTGGCSNVMTSVSECAPDKTCTLDRGTRETICMDLENDLDVGGIIVTIIFGVAIVAGIATITFLCCKDRKEQKRLAAKAATVELHRAATKKKKEAEARAQRAPLMQQEQERQRDVSTGSTDPFHDRNRS